MGTTILGKTVRYGTSVTPSVSSNILPRHPNVLKLSPSASGPHDFEQISIMGTDSRSDVPSTGKFRFPSISTILGTSQSQKQLFFWQLRTIKQMGFQGFRKFMNEKKTTGVCFHSIIGNSLTNLSENGSLPNEDEVLKAIDGSMMQNYMKSILPVFRDISPKGTMILEQMVSHPILCYYGRFDAVLIYKDSLILVDWKTASLLTTKQKMAEREPSNEIDELKGLYGAPMQIAAYVGAFNADPTYASLPKIQRGAIVLANENGSEARVIEMDLVDLKDYWAQWLRATHTFWWDMQESPTNEISYIFDGKPKPMVENKSISNSSLHSSNS